MGSCVTKLQFFISCMYDEFVHCSYLVLFRLLHKCSLFLHINLIAIVHLPIDWVSTCCQVMVLRGGERGGLTVLYEPMYIALISIIIISMHACINLTSGFSHFLSCH